LLYYSFIAQSAHSTQFVGTLSFRRSAVCVAPFRKIELSPREHYTKHIGTYGITAVFGVFLFTVVYFFSTYAVILLFTRYNTFSTTAVCVPHWTSWTRLKAPTMFLRYAFRFWSLWYWRVLLQFSQCTTIIIIQLHATDTRQINPIRTLWDWSTRYVRQYYNNNTIIIIFLRNYT